MPKLSALRLGPQLLLFVCLSSLTACSHAPKTVPASLTQHSRIQFNEQKIGLQSLSIEKTVSGYRTTTSIELHTRFRGLPVVSNRIVETEEERSGRPLRFSRTVDIPHASSLVTGDIRGNSVSLHVIRDDKEITTDLQLPDDFLLGESLRDAMRQAAEAGQGLVYSHWDYTRNNFRRVRVVFEKETALWRVNQFKANEAQQKLRSWIVDANFQPVQRQFEMLGQSFSIVRCADRCDQDAITPFQPLDYQMLKSPYRVGASALKGHIRYQLQLPPNLAPVITSEQSIQKTETGWTLDVCANCAVDSATVPPDLQDYLQATSWLESDAEELREAASNVIGSTTDADKQMRMLTRYATQRLADNPQFAGYASALQAFRSRTGDCTEYALLLAALGRAAGVPTRVLFGLSYSREKFHGKRDVFMPHAWVQAWVNGAWRSYDAGLEEFDAGHIALKVSDGEQRDFISMFDGFADLKILSLQHVVKKGAITKE